MKSPNPTLPYAQMGAGWYKIKICYKHRITPWKWVTKPSSDIGMYFWASSVSGLVRRAKASAEFHKLLKTKARLAGQVGHGE